MSDPTEPHAPEDPDDADRAAARAERFARREARPGRRLLRAAQDFLPLIVLTVTVIGALATFYARETGRTLGGDLAIAAVFLVALGIVAYLNPRVQMYVQTRGRRRD